MPAAMDSSEELALKDPSPPAFSGSSFDIRACDEALLDMQAFTRLVGSINFSPVIFDFCRLMSF